MRVSDPLLPQVASDFGTSLGAASFIVTAYSVSYGFTQVFSGVIGDRLGKCQAVAVACGLSGVLVLLCALSQSLPQLALARLVSAPAAAIIVPLGLAYIGDVVPYARRQTAVARYMAGQMIGMISGQVAGGIIGDHFGWRMVFVVLAGVFILSALALASQFRGNPWTKPVRHEGAARQGMIARYRALGASAVGALHRARRLHRRRRFLRWVYLRRGQSARPLRPELLHRRRDRRGLRSRLHPVCRHRPPHGGDTRRTRAGGRRRRGGDARHS